MTSAAAVSAGTLMLLSAAGASADPKVPPAGQKVVICHAEDSYKNPYTSVDVDVAGGWDGHDKHTGPVFSLDIPKHTDWGDIIPPTTYDGHDFELNWDADGQAIWHNGCALPTDSATATVTATVTATQTETVTATATETVTQTVPGSPSTVVSTVTAPASTVTVTQTVPAGTSEAASSSTGGTSAAASSSEGVAGVSSSRPRSSAEVAGDQAGPIPAAVDAGRHAPVSRSGLALWGSLLLAFGGLCGVMAGLRRPRARRAH